MNSLPKKPYTHRIYMVLAKPTELQEGPAFELANYTLASLEHTAGILVSYSKPASIEDRPQGNLWGSKTAQSEPVILS